MAVTLKQVEAVPSSYPDAPAGLSDAAAALDASAIWQRIESYVASRWSEREVIWTVEGEGDWTAPLTPTAVTHAEVWEGGAWSSVSLPEGPWGYFFPGDGPYRITASVGGGNIPAAVSEGYRRLAEYLADQPDRAGVSQYSTNVGGEIQESYDRSATWVARAMQLSGAADLLRPYRRAA